LNIFVIADVFNLGVSTITKSVLFLNMKNIYLQILEQQLSDQPLVLATVIQTKGSTPQKPGSSALFSNRGLLSGTVGGGIVEGKVQTISMEALKSKKSGLYNFNLANDISNKEDAICGGQISVLIDADLNDQMDVFELIKHALTNRIPGVLITRVSHSGQNIDIKRFWMSKNYKPLWKEQFIGKVESAADIMLTDIRRSDFMEIELPAHGQKSSSRFFLEPVFPAEQLVIAGAGHIGKALARLGSILDFEVTVVDDRAEYANYENIPDADHIIVSDIGNTMRELEKDENTYVVIVTRGHKDDAEALKPCIGSNISYTGMIGSKNKVAKMRTDFIEKGFASEKQWRKIHAPVGLDIRSQTVEEIAISIAAQLVLVRNSKNGNKG
jgi:xanthine dehydrogenase accessory factor